MYSLSLSVATPSAVVYFEYTTTRVSPDHNSHTFCHFVLCLWNGTFFVVVGWSFFSVLHPLLQCLIKHLRSIRTCPNGIRVRWQIWEEVSVLSLPLSVATPSPDPLLCILNVRQLEIHRITLLTRFVLFVLVFLKWYSFLLFVVCWSFLFFVAPFSCSVSKCTSVQSGRVQMEYGGGDTYG